MHKLFCLQNKFLSPNVQGIVVHNNVLHLLTFQAIPEIFVIKVSRCQIVNVFRNTKILRMQAPQNFFTEIIIPSLQNVTWKSFVRLILMVQSYCCIQQSLRQLNTASSCTEHWLAKQSSHYQMPSVSLNVITSQCINLPTHTTCHHLTTDTCLSNKHKF